MSLGAIGPEAHECLAIAMNRIGGKSNSGEGGEDPKRFHRRANGDLANSAIKQIASARFGVNATYLASAKEIEIKMAQGAKPGEGGQLPGHKVSAYIAQLRNATPGVALISPPPHHDIYSIEDLAQLIHDLKQVNPRARVCVKLVAEAGVGTIAAGVAKAHADIILISGHEGGTGASPLSSIKNAGSAWELGVAEAHQVLMLNGLRNRVTLRTDGGMRTGLDIVIATLLGAEEYNFGTAALIASGCVYVRQCHLNTCPVGIATLDEKFRAKFKGKPENIVNFFNGVADEVREIMARLGYRTINEMVGRVESLKQRQIPGHPKANLVNLKRLLTDVSSQDDPNAPRHHTRERNDGFHDRPLDDTILQDANEAINLGQPLTLNYRIRNINRSAVTKVSGEIAYQYGLDGLPENLLELNFNGSAGQSFAAFLCTGLRVVLHGEANDYVGKGMSGGTLIVRPPAKRKFVAQDNAIVGNTCLYGATGGDFFANGRAGERFAVRNSGGTAVVEGVGDHGCEYMTNGCVVVLGPTGRNFGAGMTGGTAFVWDPHALFESNVNMELVRLDRVSDSADEQASEATHPAARRTKWAASLPPGFWRPGPNASDNSGKSPRRLRRLPWSGRRLTRRRTRNPAGGVYFSNLSVAGGSAGRLFAFSSAAFARAAFPLCRAALARLVQAVFWLGSSATAFSRAALAATHCFCSTRMAPSCAAKSGVAWIERRRALGRRARLVQFARAGERRGKAVVGAGGLLVDIRAPRAIPRSPRESVAAPSAPPRVSGESWPRAGLVRRHREPA